MVGGGSDNHLILIDLRSKNVNGAVAAFALEVANIVMNKNGVPFDTNPPFYPSGIRMGTPAITTRGMKEKDMGQIGVWIAEVIEECKAYVLPPDKETRREFMKKTRGELIKNKKLLAIAAQVKKLMAGFSLP